MELVAADPNRSCDCGLDDRNAMATAEYFANPYVFLDELRESCPVHWSKTLGGWLLTRHEDCDWCLKRPDLFTSRHHTARQVEALPADLRLRAAPLIQALDGQMVMMQDPPDHTKQRRTLNKAFLPSHIAALEQGVRDIAFELLEPFRDSREMDLVRDFAQPLPGTVLANFLGVPRSDQPRFVGWGGAVAAFVVSAAGEGVVDNALQAFDEMTRYIEALLDDRRARSDKAVDVISLMSDPSAGLGHQEIVATCVQLLFAGHLTSTILLSLGTHTLIHHPDQTARLVADPSLFPLAVEELMRFDGPAVIIPARTATTDVECHGKQIAAGEAVFAGLGPAGRDPRVFADPYVFDVARPLSRHLAFGAGPHFCVGAPVSRLEGRVALAALLQVAPEITLTTDALPWRPVHVARILDAMPVAW